MNRLRIYLIHMLGGVPKEVSYERVRREQSLTSYWCREHGALLELYKETRDEQER